MKKQRYHATIMRTSWLIIFMSFFLSACVHADSNEDRRTLHDSLGRHTELTSTSAELPKEFFGLWHSYSDYYDWYISPGLIEQRSRDRQLLQNVFCYTLLKKSKSRGAWILLHPQNTDCQNNQDNMPYMYGILSLNHSGELKYDSLTYQGKDRLNSAPSVHIRNLEKFIQDRSNYAWSTQIHHR
jgi:hypothetical protein